MGFIRNVFAGLILLLCLFSSTDLKAQSAVSLNWEGYESLPPSELHTGKVPIFSGASLELTHGIPYYRVQIPFHVGSIKLSQTVYQPFSAADQKLLAKFKFANDPEVNISNATKNKAAVAIVSILPIRVNPQTRQLEKLVSFNYSVSPKEKAIPLSSTASTGFTSNSVLSTGTWYKLGVTASGVHKIDKALLQTLGINTQSIDPRTIQVYGNGGGMLPQPNSTPRPDDLKENAIWVTGESDGKFDDADYALFYAKGPHTWMYDEAQKQFVHQYNVYSDTAYYFLRVGSMPGARIKTRGQDSGASQVITSYNEHLFHERDLKNMVFSGREWYGEEFSSFTTSREINFSVSDVVPDSEIKLTAFLMANSPADCSFNLKLNNHNLGEQRIPNRGNYSFHPEGTNSIKTYTLTPQAVGSGPEYKASLNFNTGGSSTSLGHLNYLELNYERQLKLYNEQTSFRSLASTLAPVSTFKITDVPASSMVWDVTNPFIPELQQHTIINNELSFTTSTVELREFIVLQNNVSAKPIPLGSVPNQNLHAQNLNGSLDFVIITHPKFLQEANRLANHRAKNSNMEVLVVTTTQVYNEFSSGAQDVSAIRDFMRMLYKRSNKSNDEHMYLLLFGDTSYDYKNRLSNNTNFVPVYQSRQSLHPISSYSSEDYFGFLDDEEGEWAENSFGDHLLDIGIGRLPAKNLVEAATLVDKIIAYDSPSHFGKWRSQITLVADDGDYNEHQNDAEFLASFLNSNAPRYNPNKIYLDLYQQAAVANGQRVPDAVNALNKAIEQGSLITNYTGHGNEISWTAEQVLTIPQIRTWKNSDKLTFLLTATCEFGRYDDPARPSGAEMALLHTEGGAVGLITTTRPVYSNGNRVLNRNFFKSAFSSTLNNTPRLGDLVLRTKNNSITDNVSGSRGVNNRNFTLLADPSMQLAYPTLNAQLTHINGKATSTDTLSALGKINLKGQINSIAGLASDFNGDLRLTVLEKPSILKTFGDEGSQPVPISLRENILYDGKATVKNGLFEVNFVVPKDIAYNYGNGKITMYASNSNTDAIGANQSVIIGGTASNAPADNTPPTLRLFMNDESFVFGGPTGKDALLLAKLFDENGINTAGLGIGHELVAIIDDNRDNPIILNDYYTAEADSYQEGRISYNLKDLEPGPHSIKVKAWDTHNNSAEEYIEFIVSNDSKFALEHVLNHPNPFSTKTTFHFDHNRAGENLEIQVQIYTISGKLIKTLDATLLASTAHVAQISWDGTDEYNDKLARGVYIYKVNVRSQKDGAKAYKFEKLVILN